MRRVVVTGMGIVSSIGNNTQEVLASLYDAKPGITGPASVEYRDEESILAAAEDLDVAYARVMAEKLDIDIAYLERRTLWSDIGLIVATAKAVFNR